jgi:hypothetical protein
MAQAQTNSTNNQANRQPITEKQIQDVEGLLNTLKGKAAEANKASDVYMSTIYAELVKVVSPIVVKAHARLHRESRAEFNSKAKALRKAANSTAAPTPKSA